MIEDKKLTLISNGRMASIAFDHLSHIIDKQRSYLYDKLKNISRSGKHDMVEYACTTSAIVALEDVLRDIKRQIDAAINIEKEITKNE